MAVKENLVSSCKKCGSICCKHVALEIDKPTSKQDYDYIRWYLLHKNVEVFVEDNGSWYLKFSSPCERLLPDGGCGAYEDRPQICRGYPPEDNDCEFEGDGNYYKYLFRSVEEFEKFLDKKKKNWRFKRT
jgi:Fe-S-cluster containining protein